MQTLFLRLIIAAVVAVVVSGLFTGQLPTSDQYYVLDPFTTACFLIATVLTALLSGLIKNTNASFSASADDSSHSTHSSGNSYSSSNSSGNNAERENGTVKWFNVSKGFGFITRANGEDIFVHYRNIRGEGRRRLFDGQSVEFAVVDGDKGLQADDVEILK